MALAELRRQRQLRRRELEGALGGLAIHAFHLEEHPSGLDDRDPDLRAALAFSHPRLGRLLREGLIREHPHPDAATTLDRTRERDPGRLDLPGGQPPAVETLQAIVAERQRRAAPGRALAASLL